MIWKSFKESFRELDPITIDYSSELNQSETNPRFASESKSGRRNKPADVKTSIQ